MNSTQFYLGMAFKSKKELEKFMIGRKEHITPLVTNERELLTIVQNIEQHRVPYTSRIKIEDKEDMDSKTKDEAFNESKEEKDTHVHTYNTLVDTIDYVFHVKKCFILCNITNEQFNFCPIINPYYRFPSKFRVKSKCYSNWNQHYAEKRRILGMRKERVIDLDGWWNNGHIVCNEVPKKIWGEANVEPIKHMFNTVYEERLRKETSSTQQYSYEFIFNKRDYPMWNKHCEIAAFFVPFKLFDAPYYPKTHTTTLSFYGGSNWDDLLIPTSEDWARACKLTFGPSGLSYKDEVEMERIDMLDRMGKAVFRGSSTGMGVDCATNLRLLLVSKFHDHELFDVGITQWNTRDQYLMDGTVDFQKPHTFPFSLSEPLSFQEQMRYKYIIYAKGHVAASRLSQCLGSKSVVLYLEDEKDKDNVMSAPDLWYSYMLNDGEHIVKVTLDTIENVIVELEKDEERVNQLANNAYRFYQNIICSQKVQLDHVHYILKYCRSPVKDESAFGLPCDSRSFATAFKWI